MSWKSLMLSSLLFCNTVVAQEISSYGSPEELLEYSQEVYRNHSQPDNLENNLNVAVDNCDKYQDYEYCHAAALLLSTRHRQAGFLLSAIADYEMTVLTGMNQCSETNKRIGLDLLNAMQNMLSYAEQTADYARRAIDLYSEDVDITTELHNLERYPRNLLRIHVRELENQLNGCI